MGDRASLAGPGSREHHDRTLEALRDSPLLSVQAVEYRLRVHRVMLSRQADARFSV
jgi:hypothetical protein